MEQRKISMALAALLRWLTVSRAEADHLLLERGFGLILEVAVLNVRPGLANEFEVAFRQASPIIASTPGYISHELQRCIETKNRYTLLVQWETIEAHTAGFHRSPQYAQWRKLLHHFYDPFPTVEHYEQVDLGSPV